MRLAISSAILWTLLVAPLSAQQPPQPYAQAPGYPSPQPSAYGAWQPQAGYPQHPQGAVHPASYSHHPSAHAAYPGHQQYIQPAAQPPQTEGAYEQHGAFMTRRPIGQPVQAAQHQASSWQAPSHTPLYPSPEHARFVQRHQGREQYLTKGAIAAPPGSTLPGASIRQPAPAGPVEEAVESTAWGSRLRNLWFFRR